MTHTAPPGWRPGSIEKRFANIAPRSYDAKSRTVEAVISRGADVARFYGTERLRIEPGAVIINRLSSSGIPLLDSHQQAGISNTLGQVTRIWFADGALMGKLSFSDTREGRKAEGMVARGEISGISAGYRVEQWEVRDEDGNIIDPDRAHWDDALTYEAVRWELIECSLVSVPADADAAIRSLGGSSDEVANAIARMECRARMAQRQRMYEAQQQAFGGRDD